MLALRRFKVEVPSNHLSFDRHIMDIEKQVCTSVMNNFQEIIFNLFFVFFQLFITIGRPRGQSKETGPTCSCHLT